MYNMNGKKSTTASAAPNGSNTFFRSPTGTMHDTNNSYAPSSENAMPVTSVGVGINVISIFSKMTGPNIKTGRTPPSNSAETIPTVRISIATPSGP